MKQKLRRLFLSEIMQDSTPTHIIAYVAIMTALCVVCNMFFEFKFADTQFSLTIFFSAMTGMIIGPLFGFVACFLGDLVGFLYNSGGFMYMPWVGISMGMVALITGFIMNGINLKFKGEVYVRIAIVCVSIFVICTVGINTTAFWILYNDTSTVPYFGYLGARLIAKGQLWNCLLNYGLLFILYPVVLDIKRVLLKRKSST